ncbi:protein S100-A8 [Monodelphis domestica]|uniref:Protein S100-A8 n=1 Tax=Monodelphis domestica TaxID=13616 RepID=F6SK92_MONDO|nr:protein S100-A8 [Monodelphis domestica]XP_007481982.1 protein S100-A8 [Monodelphis domestica]
MATKLECAINCLVEVFHKYSLTGGHPHALSREQFGKLLEKECSEFTKKSKKTVPEFMKELDINQDGFINFEEFLILTLKMVIEHHEDSHKE